MAVIHRKQLSAMGIHYLYYPLDYMLDAQAKAGFQTIELVGMAPHSHGPYRLSGYGADTENGGRERAGHWLFHTGVRGVSIFDVFAGTGISRAEHGIF